MSKVSFRARALDASKPMPVYKDYEIPDMKDFAQINRSVPQMPTGMEKEEETEHHLQRALSAQQVYGSSDVLVIPIPEVHDISKRFHTLYPDNYILSKQYIHVQALGVDQEVPDYDLDSDDDLWLAQQRKKMEITPLKFEEMVDRLEKGSGQQMVTLQEAKLLLKDDDDLILAVYNYWLSKRLKMQQTLITTVKSERRDGTTTKNPYVAFRRRTEKMQTRKNRKNDEVSYEKMLKLRRDLQKTLTLLELLKRREKSKKELLQLTIEVVAKRNEMEDFSGAALTHAEEERAKHPTFVSPFALNGHGEWMQACPGDEVPPGRHKRRYRKRKQPLQQNQVIPHITMHQFQHQQSSCDVDIMDSSDEDILSPCLSESDHEDKNDPDGMFAFKRRDNCYYHQPVYCGLGNWPWHGSEEGGKGDNRFCFSLTSMPTGCVGYARRRVGRGGRVIFDRGDMLWDEAVKQSDHHSNHHHSNIYSDYIVYIRDKKIPWYRPKSHPYEKTHRCAGTSNVQGRCGYDERRTQGRPSSEFDVESFQSHQEQLLDRQQEQQQRLFLERQHDAANISDLEPTVPLVDSGSQFTLDSACAEFAVQALIEPTQLSTVSILEGTTPSSADQAAASPIGSRTGSHQLSFSLVNKAADSVNINVPNNKNLMNSQPLTAHCRPDSPMKAELPIIASQFLSSSATLLQKSLSTSSLRQTSSFQPVVVSSIQSVTLTAASLVSSGPLSSSATFLLSKTNRPITSSTYVRSSGLSSSLSANNALQLNFPASSASLITLASSPLLSSLCNPPVITFPSYSSTTIPTSAVTTTTAALQPQSTLNNKVSPGCSAANFYKLPVSAPISDFDMLRPNHEEILFGIDTGIPMDVT